MKFSERTLAILKNYTTINQSILLKPGNELRTINAHKSVMSVAKIDDEIPSEACIYDLSRFLSVYALYKEPEITFEEKNFIISQGKRKTRYIYADKSMIISPPEKDIKLPSGDVVVDVSWADMESVIKASKILQLPEIAFVGKDGSVSLEAMDSENKSKDTFGVELTDTSDNFTLIIKTENLNLIPQDYKVTLSSKNISKFEGKDVVYFIAVDSKSKYSKGTSE